MCLETTMAIMLVFTTAGLTSSTAFIELGPSGEITIGTTAHIETRKKRLCVIRVISLNIRLVEVRPWEELGWLVPLDKVGRPHGTS